MEKISKNLFRMLRDESVEAGVFVEKFKALKKKLDERVEVHLDSEYQQNLKAYIGRLYQQTCVAEGFNDEALVQIREPEMSNLNRLQKMKNGISYKKDKHKSKHKNEDWG